MIETDFGVTRAVQSLQNYQVYLNINELEKQGKDVASVKKAVIKALQAKPFIITAFETDKLALTTLP